MISLFLSVLEYYTLTVLTHKVLTLRSQCSTSAGHITIQHTRTRAHAHAHARTSRRGNLKVGLDDAGVTDCRRGVSRVLCYTWVMWVSGCRHLTGRQPAMRRWSRPASLGTPDTQTDDIEVNQTLEKVSRREENMGLPLVVAGVLILLHLWPWWRRR